MYLPLYMHGLCLSLTLDLISYMAQQHMAAPPLCGYRFQANRQKLFAKFTDKALTGAHRFPGRILMRSIPVCTGEPDSKTPLGNLCQGASITPPVVPA
jgi:hypothetical protein